MWPFNGQKSLNEIQNDAHNDPDSIGNILIETGMINEDDLLAAIQFQIENPDIMLGEALIKLGSTERGIIDAVTVIQMARRSTKNATNVIRFACEQTKRISALHDSIHALTPRKALSK